MSQPTFEEQWQVIKERGIDVLVEYLINGKKPHPSVFDEQGREKTILFSNEEYATLYTQVYNMSTRGKEGHKVYQQYQAVLQWFCSTYMAPAMQKASDSNKPVEFLQVISACLDKHKVFVLWLHHIFYFLDRFHVALAGVDNLKNCSSKIWVNDYIVPLTSVLVKNILLVLEMDRISFLQNESQKSMKEQEEYAICVKNITSALMEFSAYNDVPLFEYRTGVINDTRTFYKELARTKLNTLSVSEYIHLVKRIIDSENDRSTTWLLGDVTISVQMTLTEVMVNNVLDHLLNTPHGLLKFLQDDSQGDLKLLFNLVVCRSHETKGIQKMAAVFKKFLIEEKGMKLLEDKQNRLINPNMKAKPIAALEGPTSAGSVGGSMASVPSSLSNPDVADYAFIKSLMDLHTKYSNIITDCFSGDFNFKLKFKEAFEFIMNHSIGGVHMACYLSTACDRLIRRSGGNQHLPITPQGVKDDCNNIVSLFTYINDKDLFAHIYRVQLSKRLLGAEEPPCETEMLFIATFRRVCGHSYSHRIEGMLLDVQSGLEMRKNYSQYLQEKEGAMEDSDDFVFTIQVLTTGLWPHTTDISLNVPRAIMDRQEQFAQWYDTITSNRKLSWNQVASQAIVQANFAKPYLIVCNAPQACLLQQFNEKPEGQEHFTTDWLKEQSGMDPLSNRKYIKSLYTKYALIVKIGEDTYDVNMQFECPARRFKLPLPVDSEPHQKLNIEEDRSLSIQACLIRIMKTRQQCSHNQLVSECVNQLNMFHPTVKQIKLQIEKCIEKDLISRSDEDPQIYKYE